ncbi:hypothetical protein L7F22_041159 [Adiantum nelumboides]|nr:hypothetical protein [Adiantum nelumboides]
MWTAWDFYRDLVKLKPGARVVGLILDKDSLWIGYLGPDLDRQNLLQAHKLWKMGFKKWTNLLVDNQWDIDSFMLAPLNTRPLLINRLNYALQTGTWPISTRNLLPHQFLCWNKGKTILPLPNLPVDNSPLIQKLNNRWGLSWTTNQWLYRFKVIWGLSKSVKQSVLLWLLAHQALWTGARAAKIGKGNGICQRCNSGIEDIHHLFFSCPFDLKYVKFLELCFVSLKFRASSYEILTGKEKSSGGSSKGCDSTSDNAEYEVKVLAK